MKRQFEMPHVVEIGPIGGRTVRPTVPRPSQRSLVEASLLRCPELRRGAPEAREHR